MRVCIRRCKILSYREVTNWLGAVVFCFDFCPKAETVDVGNELASVFWQVFVLLTLDTTAICSVVKHKPQAHPLPQPGVCHKHMHGCHRLVRSRGATRHNLLVSSVWSFWWAPQFTKNNNTKNNYFICSQSSHTWLIFEIILAKLVIFT